MRQWGDSGSPYIMKTYEMVNDKSTNDIINWCNGGTSFVIKDTGPFKKQILTKYFQHRNLYSFKRQLM